MSDRVLLLPPAATATASRLAEAAAARGLQVRTLHRRPVPPHLRGRAHVYGGEAFASEVASALDVALLVPAPGWLPGLPAEFAGRHVRCAPLGEARRLDGPIFVKPAQGKAFPPGVYEPDISTTSAPVRPQGAPRPMAAQHPPAGKPPAPAPARPQGAPRPEATQRAPTNEPFSTGLPDETPVLLSDPVTFAGEYRLHVLDGRVHAASRYATYGVLDAAPLDVLPERAAVEGFAADLLAHTAPDLPSAVVVDVGLVTAPGPPRYAVVEANEAWFSNCYAAPPDRVLDVVVRAAAPRADLAGVTGAVGQPPGRYAAGRAFLGSCWSRRREDEMQQKRHRLGLDDERVREFWRERHICTLVTLRPDGTPHAVPIGAVLDADEAIVRVITSGGSAKARHVRAAGPDGLPVAVSQVDGRRWSTIEGRAVLRTDAESVADAERRYAQRYKQPRVNPERVVVEIAVGRVLGNV